MGKIIEFALVSWLMLLSFLVLAFLFILPLGALVGVILDFGRHLKQRWGSEVRIYWC